MEPRRLLAHSALSVLLSVLSVSSGWADTPTTRTTSYTYYPNGLKHTEDGPRTDVSDVTTWEYIAGAVSKTTNALGHIVEVTSHTAGGLPLTIIDANGVTTTLTYDLRDRLTSRTVAGRTTSYEYDGVGQLTKVIAPDGSYLAYEYDAAHRLMAMSNNLGERVDYSRDLASNITRIEIKGAGGALRYAQDREYDALSRLHKVIGQNGQVTTNQYDPEDNPTSSSDVLGNGTIQTFDALNRLSTVTDALNGVVTYTYNAQDEITSVTDAKGNTTTYDYDGLGNLLAVTSPDTGTTTYEYDAAGNKTKQTDARGVISLYSYDALNRLTAISYPATSSENVTYSYDSTANGNKGVGQLTGYSNQAATTSLVYDEWGNIVQQTDIIGTQIYTTAFEYDTANRLSQITYPSGRIVYYSRDVIGRITTVQTRDTSASPLVTLVQAVGYEPYGAMNQLTFGNGVITSLTYDIDYRVERIATDSIPVWDYVYDYDLADNLVALADQASLFNKSFSYDALYRVITDVNDTGTWTYQYDINGNRTRRTQLNTAGSTSTQNLTYAATSNQLTKVGSTVQTRDPVGNLMTYGGRTYTYNAANRLSSSSLNGTLKVQMVYNALGQRVAKEAISKPLHQHYDLAGQYLGTTAYNSTGTLYQRFEWIYLDQTPIAQVRTNYGSSNNVSSRRSLMIHADHLGTPRAMTDTAKRLVWRWDGNAFGQATPNQNPDGDTVSDILNLRFPGQIYDQESGLFYNMNRYYDPVTGRYLTSDPIGIKGGLNTYGYSKQNPLKYTDPSGLGPVSVGACVLALEVGSHYANAQELAELMESVESLREQIAKIDGRIEEECDLAKKAALQKIRDELVADYVKNLKQNAPALYPNFADALGDHVKQDIGCGLLLRAPGW